MVDRTEVVVIAVAAALGLLLALVAEAFDFPITYEVGQRQAIAGLPFVVAAMIAVVALASLVAARRRRPKPD